MKALWSETREHVLKLGGRECTIVLRHIGDNENKTAWDKLHAGWRRTRMHVRQEARASLLVEFKTPGAAVQAVCGDEPNATFETAIDEWLKSQESWVDLVSERVKTLITLGIVDGEARYHELFRAGGPDMLTAASAAVVRFHSIGEDLGES